MRLFYSNEIQYEPYIEIKDNSSTYYGASRMPSESEWKKINEGMTREEVRSIIIIKPVKTIYDDGSEMWRYYSAPINDNEVDVTKSLKGESVFNVYFRDNKVRKKEISKF
jgi:outer membrane protein assembly factor BamE (lipoprotein component of BamABCDE complex)